jgi:hypothetical protein
MASASHDTMCLPMSQTDDIRAGKSTGVGALPGLLNTMDVAVLPEEAVPGASRASTATGEMDDYHHLAEAAVLRTAATATNVAAERPHELHHKHHHRRQPRSHRRRSRSTTTTTTAAAASRLPLSHRHRCGRQQRGARPPSRHPRVRARGWSELRTSCGD